MYDKTLDVQAIVSQIKDGDCIAIGGWGPLRKPMEVIRGILASNLKDLTIMSYAAMDLDILIGAGKVKKAIYGFVSFEGLPGNAGNFKRARQEGTIQCMELSEFLLIAALRAAAERIPFYPTRTIGTDVLTVNPEIKVIQDPYGGEQVVAMPAIKPDVALIHVNVADKFGNARIKGDPYLDDLMVRAAGKAFITAEKVVSVGDLVDEDHNPEIFGPWISGVAEVPQGALPTGVYSEYNADNRELKKYGEASKSPEAFKEYLDAFVGR